MKSSHLPWILAGACALFASATTRAELIVNEDLGTLSFGTTNLAGNTADGANNADYYANTVTPQGNWGNEYVYRFQINDPGLVSVTLHETDGDPDFFFLNGLATSFIDGKNAAVEDLEALFLDDPLPDTGLFGLYAPGTYYVSIDAFSGFDPAPAEPASVSFNLDLTISDVEPPADAIDLGTIALVGEPLAIDTLGSEFDTLLGLYGSDGFLIEVSDDIDDETLQSRLDFPDGLASGEYYVGLGGFETAFADGFLVTPATDSQGGNYTLNFPGGPVSGEVAEGEEQWFRFEVVVPEPSTGLLLAIVALALLAGPVCCGRGKAR